MTINVYKRNDHYVRITINENNEPLDLTDLDIFFIVTTGDVNVIQKTKDEINIVNAQEGLIEIHLTHNDTDIDTGRYKYELLVTDVNGNRYTVLQSNLHIQNSYAKEC